MNERKYQIFTEDNQDIVMLLTILFYLNLYPFDKFLIEFDKGIHKDKLIFFKNVLEKRKWSFKFIDVFEKCVSRIENNDQTPFIEFRYKEFETTIKRMDFLSDETPEEVLLEDEIMITKEVYDILMEARDKKSTILGLSDKPEASSLPNEVVKLPPLHLKTMKIYPK